MMTLPPNLSPNRSPISGLSQKTVALLSAEELLEVIHNIEVKVERGTVQSWDYEAYVLCQQALRRKPLGEDAARP